MSQCRQTVSRVSVSGRVAAKHRREQITRKLPPHTYTDLLRAGAAWLVFITDMPKYHKCLFSKFQAPSSSQLHQLYDG